MKQEGNHDANKVASICLTVSNIWFMTFLVYPDGVSLTFTTYNDVHQIQIYKSTDTIINGLIVTCYTYVIADPYNTFKPYRTFVVIMYPMCCL